MENNNAKLPEFNGDFDDINYKTALLNYLISNIDEKIQANADSINEIKHAYEVAYEAHKPERRKGGKREPYITHPVSVAIILSKEMGLGTVAIMSALLHDVAEDTSITLEQIEKEFDKKVKTIVKGVTKITNKNDRYSTQILSLYNLFDSFKDDYRVIFVKIADRLHNMRTMEDMPENNRAIKTGENLYIYAPLAHKAGMYEIRNELQDKSFMYRYHEKYKQIEYLVKRDADVRTLTFENYKKTISDILFQNNFKDFRIEIIEKSLFSLYQKMEKYNVEYQHIHNFNSVRVIINTDLIDAVNIRKLCMDYWLALTEKLRANQSTFRDWIQQPKDNGFSALVCDMFSYKGELFELQIMTEEKHIISKRGFAKGLKHNIALSKLADEISELERGIKQTVENKIIRQDNSVGDANYSQEEILRILESIKRELNTSRIKTYTPRCDAIELPKDALVLDFAFKIHTQVGLHCIGAKIKGQIVSPTTKLNDNDTIDILVEENACPNPRWEYLVATARAKEEISRYFKNINKSESTQKYLNPDLKINNKIPLIVDENLKYVRPVCCNPLPGEECIAYQDAYSYIHIHKKNCSQAILHTAVDGKKTTNVIWKPIKEYQAMLKKIAISGMDRIGIIKDLVTIITEELNVNMQSINIAAEDTGFKGTIGFYVYHSSFLKAIVNKILTINNILDVKILD